MTDFNDHSKLRNAIYMAGFYCEDRRLFRRRPHGAAHILIAVTGNVRNAGLRVVQLTRDEAVPAALVDSAANA